MSDEIVKEAVLHAPLAKVWDAIGDSKKLGTWFGMKFEGPFVEGRTVEAAIAMTQVDDDVAKHQEPFVGLRCDFDIERIVPNRLLSFRWPHGAQVGPAAPKTLVSFALEEVPGGTRLTITETGFDALPPELRAKAYTDNEGGWEIQLTLVAKYLSRG